MSNKILIVDDTQSWLSFHKELINELYSDRFDITTAGSALEGFNIILSNRMNPFKFIITDLCMESDFLPLLAGEWLIQNIKTIKEYAYSGIIIVSSMYNIEEIAKKYNVECISKSRISANKSLMSYMFEKNLPFTGKIM